MRRIVAIVLIIAALLWWNFARLRREQAEAGTPSPLQPTGAAESRTAASPPSTPSNPTALNPKAPPFEADLFRPPPLELSTGMLPWEKQLADAAARGGDAKGKAHAIISLLPHLPEEALATAAEQAVERLPDTDYTATALPVLIDPRTSAQVLSVLFADLMERPDSITLPALLTIAQNSAHPFAPSALDNLRLLLRADFGTDWNKWSKAIAKALQPK